MQVMMQGVKVCIDNILVGGGALPCKVRPNFRFKKGEISVREISFYFLECQTPLCGSKPSGARCTTGGPIISSSS